MQKKYVFAISLFVLSTNFAFSKSIAIHKQGNIPSDGYRASYNKCVGKSAGVTLYMLNCIADETKYQEQRMHKNYNKLLSILENKDKKTLIKIQNTWLLYNKLRSHFDYSTIQGGTLISIIAASEYLSRIKCQADYLQDQVDYINNGF